MSLSYAAEELQAQSTKSAVLTECEQSMGGKLLHTVKLHPQDQPHTSKGLQAVLSQSFQPGTPELPEQADQDLLHSLSTTSLYSTGSGQGPSLQASVSNNNHEGSPSRHRLAQSSGSVLQQPSSSVQQQSNLETPDSTPGVDAAADMLPEHSLVAQMSTDAQISTDAHLSTDAQMSSDAQDLSEPQQDALTLEGVDAKTAQLAHILTTLASGNGRHLP